VRIALVGKKSEEKISKEARNIERGGLLRI
jgi:hypothetical protein